MFWRHINNSEISLRLRYVFVLIFACTRFSTFFIFFVFLGGEFLHTRHFPKLTAEKMCNQNSRFIHWQSFKTKIFFCSPQRNKKFAIFLLFSFCFVLFGACRIRRDCVFFFFCYSYSNKRHNSCWTIWISTHRYRYRYICRYSYRYKYCLTCRQLDRHVWEHNKNLISRILARTVIENFPRSPLLTSPRLLHSSSQKTKTDNNKQRAWHLKHLAIALAFGCSVGYSFWYIWYFFLVRRGFSRISFWPDWQLSCPVMLRYVKFQMS